jgi:hypothetical protein
LFIAFQIIAIWNGIGLECVPISYRHTIKIWSAPVKRSAAFFETMAEATKEGKKALADFLAKWAA